MHYPATTATSRTPSSDDGDPVDVLVITPFPLRPASVVRCRPFGVLQMEDEAGGDSKILAVPIDKVPALVQALAETRGSRARTHAQIQHFFEHYKDLEKGKWVKVKGWAGPDAARREILEGVEAYKTASPKPAF